MNNPPPIPSAQGVRASFIVGSPRSGTTLLRLMLDAHPNISCGPETSFLTNFEPILGRYWDHLSLYGFEESYWAQKISDFFASFQEEYAQKRGKRRWIDKTPQYTPHLPFILRLFPNCQLIHIIRDGRDVATSYLNRWGYRAALRGIKAWQQHVTAARAVGERLPETQYYELRYEALVREPESTLRGLLSYLQEPWHDAVLHYLEEAHDIQPTYAAYTSKRRHSAGEQTAIYASRIGAWRRELPLPLKIVFYFWSGRLLKQLEYQ